MENQFEIFFASGAHPVDWLNPCTRAKTPKANTRDETPIAIPAIIDPESPSNTIFRVPTLSPKIPQINCPAAYAAR